MIMYSGKSEDGSDAEIVDGVYESPCGLYWSSKPITREQRVNQIIDDHCGRYHKSYRDLYIQVAAGSRENLPKWVRTYFIKHMEQILNNQTHE